MTRAASVDDTADVELHDPDSEAADDTTEHLNEYEESSHNAESNHCFDSISNDNPEDEQWVDYITRATRRADDLLAASGITSWILSQSQIYWRHARMIATHHEHSGTKLVSNQLEPSYLNQATEGYWKQERLAMTWEDDFNIYVQPDRSNRDNNDLTSDVTWLTTAEDSSKSDAMESYFISTTPHQPYHHGYDNPANNARPKNKCD